MSIAILGLSVFALFTARDDSDFIAKAGTVNIDVQILSLTNSDNINPGDNDPSNPEDIEATTDHVFEYKISNLGTKSARTRQTLILTAKNPEQTLDARFLAFFKDGEEIESKTYVLDDDTEVTSLEGIAGERYVKAVKYTFVGDTFDGLGDDISAGGNAEKESFDGIVKQSEEISEVSKIYSLDFALLRGAGNKYQAADFVIDVVVEAMQYRNTDENDWNTVSTVSRTYSTAEVGQKVVPARDEDKSGNKLDDKFIDNESDASETIAPDSGTGTADDQQESQDQAHGEAHGEEQGEGVPGGFNYDDVPEKEPTESEGQ